MDQADSVHSTPPTNTSAEAPLGSPAESAGESYVKTPVTPEEAFQAIGRLRKDARDEIERLLNFLDETDNHMEREPDGDELDASYPEGGARGLENPNEDDEDTADDEPSLGSSGHGEPGPISYAVHPISDGSQMIYDCEAEHDGAEPEDEGGDGANEDDEPSLGWTVDGCITNTPAADCDYEPGISARPPQNRTSVPANVAEETGFIDRIRKGFAVKRTDRPSNGRGLR